ncbi:Tellurite resistance TerB [Paenibacillus sp. CFBP13512]|uniref:tellurite resistance TerB family protein n=1 Tax=Paenibacillus sp. CFBP13512 TaxID=2184007 RepID=UPI0010C0D2CE|nr:tellurite resistance TerB family protein [Paenibacillus sp. CFBP13512]TKJ87203.1 Tellurite resistance TerB [Paenibacillus sp. CFBP13512]
MSQFRNWLKSSKNGLVDQVKKFKNKDFLDAIVAGCALVAAADGNISADEKQKMAGYIGRNEQLKVFEMSLVIARFNHYVENFDFDAMIGKQEALKAISKFASKPEEGRLIVAVCSAIGSADGDFDTEEQNTVRDIIRTLGLNASEFGL